MSVWTVPTGELTVVEQRLVQAVTNGSALRLGPNEAFTSADAQNWGSERAIRAVVIRDLLRGRHAPDPDPQGIRLIGAQITGQLDLDDLHTTVPIRLIACHLGHGVRAVNSHLKTLDLANCTITNDSGPALHADGLTVDNPTLLEGGSFTGTGELGAVRLSGAHLGGQLNLEYATVTNESGPALHADMLTVADDMYLAGATFTGAGELGAVSLYGAHIGGYLDLQSATVTNERGPALFAKDLAVTGDAYLPGGTFIGTGELGAVRLFAAHIGGQLNLENATVTNESGPALHADNLKGSQAILRGGTFTGTGEQGGVRLSAAQLGGQLHLEDATVTNESGPALLADFLTVDNNTILEGGTFIGTGELGAVRMLKAHLGGQLSLEDATVTNESGPALNAYSLTIEEDILLDNGAFTGIGERGAVNLFGAHIGGQLSLEDATVTNESGPALNAYSLTVDSNTRLSDGTFTGTGKLGAVRLVGAHIRGQLELTGATVTNESGPALNAADLTVDSNTFLNGATLTGTGQRGAVSLLSARLDCLVLDPEVVGVARSKDTRQRWRIDGMTYAGQPEGVSHTQWLGFLRHGTTTYAAQPYRHLAAIDRAAGHDTDARRTLMDQRRDQLDRAGLDKKARAWGWFTRITLGYGYQPWLALVWLTGVVVTSVLLSVFWFGPTGLEQPATAVAPGSACPWTERVEYAFSTTIPLITTDSICQTTTTSAGESLSIAGWALSLLAALLLTLFLAGFTNAVRKS